jgi:hypothetical protein
VGRRLVRINLVSSCAFVIGGSLFATGAFLAQRGEALVTVNTTYLVGGFFFSLGAYASVLLVANTAQRPPGDSPSHGDAMRWWGHRPGQRDWRGAVVLFVGTLLFAVSLVAAFAEGLTPRQSNGWIWLPDMLGCVCFLVSGHLAMLEVGGGRVTVRAHVLTWWVVSVNQLGSVLFLLAGLAAFVRPATAAEVNVGLVNWGTFTGAVCFAIGGVIQSIDRPNPTRMVVQQSHEHTGPA